MNVVLCTPAFAQNGRTHVHSLRYIRLLQLAGYDVTLVEHEWIETPETIGVTVRYFPRRYDEAATILRPLGDYFYRRGLRRLWRRASGDICHVQWVDEQIGHLARAGLRPLIATAWGSDLNLTAKLPVEDPARRAVAVALRALDLLIVDSEDMIETAASLAGRPVTTKLLPIGIDTSMFRPHLMDERNAWRARLGIDPGATVMLSPRQLGANYRQDEIVRAFAALDPTLRARGCLIVRTFGHGNGLPLAELQTLARNVGVADGIRWIGDVDYADLPGLYAAADMAINFPIMDAFPVTFLECFACGVPVITNFLAAYESNGVLPYLTCVRESSAVGLAAAIEATVRTPGRHDDIVAAARAHVVEHYDEHVSAATLKAAYDEVLHRRSG
jgi:D-inositol-3-phosphate glycosyltransferase